MAEKANHHFIPQFYLRGFAVGLKRKAKVFTVDLKQKKSFSTLVRNVGSRRHFNRVEIDGVCPNFVEDGFSEIETEIAPYIADVVEEQCFPTAKHKSSVFSLMAYTAVRNPAMRNNLTEFHERNARMVLDVTTATDERWQSEIHKLKSSGFPFKKKISRDEVRSSLERGDFAFSVDQTHLISEEFHAANVVFDQLVKRNWCFIVPIGQNFFITSDYPTALFWSDGRKPGFWGPGYAVTGTTVYFPLATSLLLVGTFEDLPERSAFSDHQTALANSVIARHATSQLYAKDGSFGVNTETGRIVTGYDLPKFLKDARTNDEEN